MASFRATDVTLSNARIINDKDLFIGCNHIVASRDVYGKPESNIYLNKSDILLCIGEEYRMKFIVNEINENEAIVIPLDRSFNKNVLTTDVRWVLIGNAYDFTYKKW